MPSGSVSKMDADDIGRRRAATLRSVLARIEAENPAYPQVEETVNKDEIGGSCEWHWEWFNPRKEKEIEDGILEAEQFANWGVV